MAHYNLGIVLSEQREADQAIEHYRQAVALRPDYAEAHYNLGRLLVEKGQLNDAIAHYERAATINPADAEAQNNLGVTLFGIGRADDAIAHYQKALEIIAARYHPSLWNVYAFHCSDGDNFESDNPAALKAAEELSEISNLFGYGEIKPLGSRYYESSMLNVFRRLDEPNFQAVLIERKEDIWPSFKAFLSKDRVKE